MQWAAATLLWACVSGLAALTSSQHTRPLSRPHPDAQTQAVGVTQDRHADGNVIFAQRRTGLAPPPAPPVPDNELRRQLQQQLLPQLRELPRDAPQPRPTRISVLSLCRSLPSPGVQSQQTSKRYPSIPYTSADPDSQSFPQSTAPTASPHRAPSTLTQPTGDPNRPTASHRPHDHPQPTARANRSPNSLTQPITAPSQTF
ncbi:hypothetical protein O3P69_004839 [Scylla paramamosain]|uniref:Uncharacterized protein n=1 Tax=Scylla paramamosain TaxID=85552 RepID=A0AAW0UDS6_SCYPA